MEKRRLNPEKLVAASFETQEAPGPGSAVLGTDTTCTWDPTENTQCFVCPAPSSPTDGC